MTLRTELTGVSSHRNFLRHHVGMLNIETNLKSGNQIIPNMSKIHEVLMSMPK